MSSIQQRLATATDPRLVVVINAAVKLKAQLRELNELRERIKKRVSITSEITATEAAFGRSERNADQFR
jgi:hypothetical protein